MKTALTQLIEIVETAFELKNNPAWQQIFESHLEAEKEQIQNAYSAGAMDACYDFDDIDAKEYYNVTFKSDE